jgi:hypothetical protein
MTWRTALIHSLQEDRPVYDKDGEPHWVDMEREPLRGYTLLPRLCTESAGGAFAVSLEPYTKERKEVHR